MGKAAAARTSRLRFARSVLAAALAATLFIGSAYAQANKGPHEFDIPAGSLESAIGEFGLQSGVQIIYDDAVINGKRVQELRGRFGLESGLDRMLRGTGLTWRFVNDSTVVVEKGKAPPTPAEPKTKSKEAPGTKEQVTELGAIVVTGTHIRAVEPIAETITFDRESIANSGYGTLQDFLETVPQVFGANIGDEGGMAIAGAFSGEQGIDLRGLGAGGTLVLVDGRRQPFSTEGSRVDIANIPTSAIERVEILTDGASAIYGSEAIGGVVNVILRKDYVGAESSIRVGSAGGDSSEYQYSQIFGRGRHTGGIIAGYQYYKRTPLARGDRSFVAKGDKSEFGGSDFRTTFANPGNIIDPDTFDVAFAIPPNQGGTTLTKEDLIAGQRNLGFQSTESTLLPKIESNSTFLSLSKNITDSFEMFFDSRYTIRNTESVNGSRAAYITVPNSNPFYLDLFGTGESLIIAYDLTKDLGPIVTQGDARTLTSSIEGRLALPNDWLWTSSVSYGGQRTNSSVSGASINSGALNQALEDSNPSTAFNPFGDGSNTNADTLEAIRNAQQINKFKSEVWNLHVLASGPIFQLPGGAVQGAIGAEYRYERLESAFADAGFQNPRLKRRVSSLFTEVIAPLLATEGNDRPVLEMSVAGRYESYDDFGKTFDPKVGLRWSPSDVVRLFANFGTSFRAPPMVQLDDDGFLRPTVRTNPDPLAVDGSGFTTFLILSGNNSSLKEETATTWSAGLSIDSKVLIPGLNISVGYHNIDYKNRIESPDANLVRGGAILADPAWNRVGVINRSPSSNELADLCALPVFGNCALTPPTGIIDLRLRNIAVLKTKSIDFNINLVRNISEKNSLKLTLGGVYNITYDRQLTEETPSTDTLNIAGSPFRLRFRSTASWTTGAWTFDGAINYVNGYYDPASGREIRPWTTLDFGVIYRVDQGPSFFKDYSISLRAVNALDLDPPFFNTSRGYDPLGASAIGRFVSVMLEKSW